MTKNKQELDELYAHEYARRFPKKDNSFKYNTANMMENMSVPDEEKSGIGDYIGEGLVQGLGGAINRPENDRREGEMGDIEKITGDILMNTQKLKQDMLNEQSETNDTRKLAKSLVPNIRQYAEAKYNGDMAAENEIGRGIFQKLVQAGVTDGEFVNMQDGNMISKNADGMESVHISDLLASSGMSNEELFGGDADRIGGMLSLGAKAKYDMNQNMSQAKLDQTYNVTEKGNMENELKRRELDSSQSPYGQLDDKSVQHIRKENITWANSIEKTKKDTNKAIIAQEKMLDAIANENSSWFSGTGASTLAHVIRWAKTETGNAKNQQLIELARQPLFKDLKNTFGARITDVDLAMWMTTQATLDQDPAVSMGMLKDRIDTAKLDVKEIEARKKVVEGEFNYSQPYNSNVVTQRVNEMLNEGKAEDEVVLPNENPNLVNNETMPIMCPDGNIRELPVNKLTEEQIKNRSL